MNRPTIRHGIYAGVALGFVCDPTLVRNVVVFAIAAAIVACVLRTELLRWRR